MEFRLPAGQRLLQNSDRVPMHLTRFKVHGAQCRYIRFEQGEVLTQLLLGNDFSVWVHYFFITGTVTLYPYTEDNLLLLHYMLKGNIPAILQGYGSIQLEENKYHLFYVPGRRHHEASFGKGNYLSVHINFHPNHIQSIARQYPVFGSILSKAEKGLRNGEQHFAALTGPDIKAIIMEILHNDLDNSEQELFLQSRIRDLLRKYVQELRPRQERMGITVRQERLLKELETYIEANLQKDLTVEHIAAHFKVSRSGLQQLCKTQYDKGIHELVMQKRMEAAATLLLTTKKSISSIAMEVSNLSFSAFSAGFKKYYQIKPLQFRKHNGQKPQK
jgi:AraC-like DNA-binding protein